MSERREPPPDDEALLRAVVGGDRGALRELYERPAPWLFLRLSRRCADATAVKDVVQETFVAVWRRGDRHPRRGEVAAWIWGIAIQKTLYVLFFIELSTRRVYVTGPTRPSRLGLGHPAGAQPLDRRGRKPRPKFLIHDRDAKFSGPFDEVLRTEDVEVIRTPHANAVAERWSEPSGGIA